MEESHLGIELTGVGIAEAQSCRLIAVAVLMYDVSQETMMMNIEEDSSFDGDDVTERLGLLIGIGEMEMKKMMN